MRSVRRDGAETLTLGNVFDGLAPDLELAVESGGGCRTTWAAPRWRGGPLFFASRCSGTVGLRGDQEPVGAGASIVARWGSRFGRPFRWSGRSLRSPGGPTTIIAGWWRHTVVTPDPPSTGPDLPLYGIPQCAAGCSLVQVGVRKEANNPLAIQEWSRNRTASWGPVRTGLIHSPTESKNQQVTGV